MPWTLSAYREFGVLWGVHSMSSGYVSAVAPCGQCGRIFSFNPVKVPSLNNVPFCRACVDAANPLRVRNGLDPIHYDDDAYEACAEEELAV